MRLIELGVPDYLIKATLIGVLAQRLVRTLCPHCKVPAPMTAEQWHALGVGDKMPSPATPHRPVGCLECRQTGYLGRTGVYELMPVTNVLRAEMGASSGLVGLRQLAIRSGMRPLRVTGAEKVAQGLTSAAEVISLTPNPNDAG
jgi:general secretion pathway protein E